MFFALFEINIGGSILFFLENVVTLMHSFSEQRFRLSQKIPPTEMQDMVPILWQGLYSAKKLLTSWYERQTNFESNLIKSDKNPSKRGGFCFQIIEIIENWEFWKILVL